MRCGNGVIRKDHHREIRFQRIVDTSHTTRHTEEGGEERHRSMTKRTREK